MGAKRAEMETRITGLDASISGLGGLERALDKVGQTGQKVSARVRDLKKEWDKPTSAGAAFAKLGAQVLGQQLSAAADAVTGPAKTSYAQALARAYEYRDATQRIATSTGRSYESVGQQLLGTSQRLGILPGRVADYGRSVRSLTGDWQGAMSGIDAYQNRALKTDRTLEELIPTAATLATTFGIKSTDDVNRFFGTLDRQARNAGVSAEVAERAFMSASQALGSLSSAKPEQISALTTAVMGGAPTPEMGESRIGAIGGLLQNHMRYLEARMRGQGKLGKGEHLYDEQGRLRGDKLFDVVEFAQKDLAKFYGTKDKKELIGRIGQSGMMSMQDAAGLLGLDVAKMRAEAAKTTAAADVTSGFLGTAAGKRTRAEAAKEARDIGLGSTMLGAQDLAVAAGGGAAGIALASAGSVFSKSVDTFFNAVEIFAGKGGKAAVGAAATSAAGAATGTAVGTAEGVAVGAGAKGLGSALLAGAALPVAAMLGVGYLGYKDITSQEGDYKAARAREQQDVAAAGASGMDLATFRRMRARGLTPEGGEGGELPMMGGGNPREVADALAKAIAGQTLRVQSVAPPSAPQGQAHPL